MTMDNRTIGQAKFPDAVVENYKMKWIPDKDSLYVHNVDEAIRLYESTASLNGFLNITPKGVLGGGTIIDKGFRSQLPGADLFIKLLFGPSREV